MPNKNGAGLSRSKKLAFWVVLIGVVWLVCDTSVYALLKLRPYLFYSVTYPTDEDLERFYSTRFHPRWGWDHPQSNQGPLGNRKAHEYADKERYAIATYGDSFTKGAGKNHETFQYQIEELTDWECLNFGVGAFGTGQALLKYLDTDVKSRYAVLGILDENIARVVMTTWKFYVENGFETKPRYIVNSDSSITLLPNPVTTFQGMQKLKDEAFVEEVSERDYWYQYRKKNSLFTKQSWPATIFLLKNVEFIVDRISTKLGLIGRTPYERRVVEAGIGVAGGLPYAHLYAEGSEALVIMRHVVDEFIRTAESRGEIPIVVLFPTLTTLDIITEFGRKPYQTLVDHLITRNANYLDFGDVFLGEDYPSYYKGVMRHFGVVGDRRVAEEIVRYIRDLESAAEVGEAH